MTRSLCLGVALVTLLCSAHASGAVSRTPSWQLSLSGGPYQPLVSTNEEEQSHYNLYYGSSDEYIFGNRPMLTSVESTTYLWNKNGLLGITAGFGMWSISGDARRCLSDLPADDTTEELMYTDCVAGEMDNSIPGSTETQLKVAPLRLGLTYRSTHLRKRFGVPVDLYVKGGVNYYLWWATTGGQAALLETDHEEPVEAGGGTAGYHLGAGIAFNLDWLDPQRPSLTPGNYQLMGSYLFMEVNKISVDGFGDATRLDMSATHFSMGISIDFL